VGWRTVLADRVHTTSPGSDKDLDLDGPFLVALESDAAGGTGLDFEIPGLATGDVVTLNLEAVITLDPAQLATLHTNLQAANACMVSGGGPTADCDGDGQDECCLNVPVPFAGRSLVRWSFADTPARFRAIEEVFDPRRPTRLRPPSDF